MRKSVMYLLGILGGIFVLGLVVWLHQPIEADTMEMNTLETNTIKTNMMKTNTIETNTMEINKNGKEGQSEQLQEFFQAVVIENKDKTILVEVLTGEWNLSGQVRIGKNNVISANEMSEFQVGDIVQIVYNGYVLETYPAQLGTVFDIYKVGETEDFQNSLTSQTEKEAVEYHYQYANLSLQIPADWEYEIVPAEQTEEDSNRTFGIRFWPMEEREFQLELFYWMDGIGLCGTGVTIDKIDFQNGMKATRYRESSDGKLWFTMIYQDLPGTYAVSGNVPETLWEKYEKTVMEILESAELGKGNLLQEEAIAIASKAFMERMSMPEEVYAQLKQTEDYAGFYDRERVRAVFQCENGMWEIKFYPLDVQEGAQVIWVDADGEVLYTVSE